MGYKIGSFNLRNLGNPERGNQSKRDFEKIAEIIKREEFDVVALQEILSEGKAFTSPGSKKSILMELGSHWDFKWGDTESDTDRRGEGYAFLWNTHRLRLATATLDDGTIRTFYPRTYRGNRAAMVRRPYYARFTPQGRPGGSNFEIRLICIHTHYGSESKEDRTIRQKEIDTVLKEIYPRISDRVYKNNMKSYTIVLGDYNAELYKDWKDSLQRVQKPLYIYPDNDGCVVVKSWDNKVVRTVQYEFTTLKSSEETDDTKPDAMRGYAHDYDHFSYEDGQFEGVEIDVQKVDAVRKYCSDDFDSYRKTVSDHVPIYMSIELK